MLRGKDKSILMRKACFAGFFFLHPKEVKI